MYVDVFIYLEFIYRRSLSNSVYIASSDRMIYEWKIGKDMEGHIRGLMKGLSQHLPGWTEENYENFSQDSRSAEVEVSQHLGYNVTRT
jgi:hypothetical protein